MMGSRPREVPVDKPSAAQRYIPKALLRDDSDRVPAAAHARRWLPTGSKPGASKHHLLNRNTRLATTAEVVVTCSDTQQQQLHALEDELHVAEDQLDAFVQDFYVAAATFTSHAAAQTALVRALLDD